MALNDDVSILSRLPLLKGIDQDALKLLAFGADHMTFPKGRVIVEQDGYLDFALVLTQGEFAIYEKSEDRLIHFNEAGTLIGEQALLVRRYRSASHIEVTQRSEFIRLRKELFFRVMEEHQDLAIKFHHYFSEKMTDFTQDLKSQTWLRS